MRPNAYAGLVCVLARHERYVEFHHGLIEEIERHIPVTAVCSIDEVAGTELQKPDGLVVLRAEDLPQKLFSLKLRDLPGVGANIEHRIQMAGIADLPGLFAVNPHQMRTIWGSV
jgi:DNA polymerase IV